MRSNTRKLLLLRGGQAPHPLLALVPDLLLDWAWPNSLYQDSAGIIPSGATDVVGHWRDLTANSRNFTQATTAQKPLNSANGLVFDASNDVLSWTADANFTLTAQTTIMVAAQANAGGTFGRWFTQNSLSGADSAASGHYIPILKAGTSIGSYADGGARGSRPVSYDQFYVFTSHHSGSAITNYLNNSAASAYTHSLNYAVRIQSIGNRLPETDSQGAITVKFCASWRRALSADELTTARNYLYSRFGVTP